MGGRFMASGEDADEMGITVQGRARFLDDSQMDVQAWRQQLVQRAGISHVLRAGTVLVVGYGLGIVALAGRGLGVVGEFHLLVVPVFALFWFGRREGIIALMLSALTLLIFAWAFCTGRLVVSVQERCDYASVSTWISPTLTFLLLGALLLVSGNYMLTRLSGALDQSRKSSQQQEMDRGWLEERMQVERAAVRRYVDYMADVADGNLSVRLALDGSLQAHSEGLGRSSAVGDEEREADDPLILLGHQLNETTASLERMIRHIRQTADGLNAAMAEILAATARVRAILSDIQKATNATVMATEEGTKQVEEGMVLASQTGESIEQLAGVIEESAQAAVQLVAGGRQQAAGVEQVAVAMQSINQATMQSLASTRQAEKSAQNLDELAHSLIEIVEQYQL
jgi:hypothetical protein